MKKYSTKILVALISLALVLFCLHVGLKYVSVVGHNEKHAVLFELSARFDMNDENSVPQWFTATAFIGISLCSALAGYMSKKRSVRSLWLAVSIVALLLSLDDVATLHEFALQIMHIGLFGEQQASVLQNAWLIFIPFVLLGLIWLAYTSLKYLPKRTTVRILSGGIIYFVGAIVVDSLVNTVPDRSFAGQGVLSGIEGGLQLIGLYVFLYAVIDYLEINHGKAMRSALTRLRSADNG